MMGKYRTQRESENSGVVTWLFFLSFQFYNLRLHSIICKSVFLCKVQKLLKNIFNKIEEVSIVKN